MKKFNYFSRAESMLSLIGYFSILFRILWGPNLLLVAESCIADMAKQPIKLHFGADAAM
jgi:hypothetical protein